MRYIIGFAIVLMWVSCQQESAQAPVNGVDKLYKDYEMQPSAQSAKIFLDSLSSYLSSTYSDGKTPSEYLVRGAEVSGAQNMIGAVPGYLLPLIKDYPDHPNRIAHEIQLGDVMHSLGVRHASNIIYDGLVKKYPDNPTVQEKQSLIEPVFSEQWDYMAYLFDQMTENPDDTGINRDAALRYVDAAEAKGLIAPNDPSSPKHLYGAAEVARSLRTFAKAMSLYDWILEKYPESDKAPNVLFIKGFILEQDYKREDEAKEVYEEFLRKYPDHTMAESAQFLLNNLGKSDEEILKELEDKSK